MHSYYFVDLKSIVNLAQNIKLYILWVTNGCIVLHRHIWVDPRLALHQSIMTCRASDVSAGFPKAISQGSTTTYPWEAIRFDTCNLFSLLKCWILAILYLFCNNIFIPNVPQYMKHSQLVAPQWCGRPQSMGRTPAPHFSPIPAGVWEKIYGVARFVLS